MKKKKVWKKNINNELFIALCEEAFPEGHKVFLVLDGPQQKTAQSIQSSLGTDFDIYSPQIDPDDFSQMILPQVKTSVESLRSFITRNIQNLVPNCYYLDYMGSPEGNEEKRIFLLVM